MSYSTYVYAIVGVHCKDVVTGKTKNKVRGCEDLESILDFCGVCGAKTWIENEVEHHASDKLDHLQLWYGYDEDEDGNQPDADESVISMIYSQMTGPSDFVVGKVLEDYDSDVAGVAVPFNVLTDEEYTEAYEQTKAALEPLGLWDPEKFGYLLYAISM